MDKFSELKAAAMAATPQKIDGAQEKTEDGCMECPCCSGYGQVDVGADYCNYDNTAIGVIFYGIGDAHVAAERYFRAANPATVLALLAELEEKDGRLAELEECVAELSELETQVKVWESAATKHLARAEEAEQRVAELSEMETHNQCLIKKNADLTQQNIKLGERLATPVRLPRPACTYADHSYPAYSRKQVEGIITSAGMRFTVEGDE